MSRKKTAKRTAASKALPNVQQLQKEFLKTPTKLSAQLNKDVLLLKQKDNKLKAAINKIKTQIKQSENRLKTTAKAKDTASGKKQYKLAKKSHGEVLKTQASLTKQAKDNTKSLENAQNQQSKLIALRKHLSQFEKEWAKNAKKTKAKTKVSAKPKQKKEKKKLQSTKENEPQIDFESSREEVRIGETETVS